MVISSKKCLKCGRSPSTHPGTKLFHYPKPGTRNYLRCEIWAKYCFPGDESSSQEFQEKLYKQEVLCDKHFKKTSFFDHPNGTTKLSAHAVPVSDDEVLQSLDEPPESNMKDISIDEKDVDPYHVTITQEKAEIDLDPHLVTIKKEPDDTDNSNYVSDVNDIKPENIKCEIKDEPFAGSSSNELPQETSLDTDEAIFESKKSLLEFSPSSLINICITSTDVREELELNVKREPLNDGAGREDTDDRTARREESDEQSSQLSSCYKYEDSIRDKDVVEAKVDQQPEPVQGVCEGIKEEYVQENMTIDRCDEEIGSRLSSDAEDAEPVTGIVLGKNLKSSAKRSLQAHPRVHVGDKPFSCDICDRKFPRRDNLQVHLMTHTGEKPFSCDLCERKFSHKCALQLHLRTHMGDKPYSCDHCERKFPQRSALQLHLRTHTGEKPFSCDVCERKFSLRNKLQIHLRTHTGEKPFSCDICERKFSLRDYLQVHLRTHTGEKPFSCDICERKFSQRSALQVHLRIHSNEKPFSCHICERKFAHRITLQVHLRTHTGEKPFSCDICERKFPQRNALQVHLRTHKGEQPFSCDLCDLKFSMRSNLQSHLRTHTAEKPFSCDICDRKFSEKSALKKHFKSYIGEKPIDCNICDRKFHKKSRLLSHLKIHTDERNAVIFQKRNLQAH